MGQVLRLYHKGIYLRHLHVQVNRLSPHFDAFCRYILILHVLLGYTKLFFDIDLNFNEKLCTLRIYNVFSKSSLSIISHDTVQKKITHVVNSNMQLMSSLKPVSSIWLNFALEMDGVSYERQHTGSFNSLRSQREYYTSYEP